MPAYITCIGRLGKDAQRKTLNGKTIINFSLATDRRRHDSPAWYECDILGDWGAAYFPHLKKGRIVFVAGVLEPNGTFLDVVVDRIEFVGSKSRNNGAGAGDDSPSSSSSSEEPQAAERETRREANAGGRRGRR